MKLDKSKYLEGLDYNKAFPKEDDPDFDIRVLENWETLNKGIFSKNKEGYVLVLYKQFYPKYNKLNKFYIFVFWLYLCTERPWNKKWAFSLGEKTNVKIINMLDRLIKKYPNRTPKTYPHMPDIQTLRKYINNKDFYEKIGVVTITPQIIHMGQILKSAGFDSKKLRNTFKNMNINHINYIMKFMKIIRTKNDFTKRELMRKLSIDVKYCEILLKQAVEQNIVELINRPRNSVLIIYKEK